MKARKTRQKLKTLKKVEASKARKIKKLCEAHEKIMARRKMKAHKERKK